MIRIICLACLLLFSLQADHLEITGDQNLNLCHNVDMFSGQSAQNYESLTLAGATPLTLFRTYGSQDALGRYVKNSLLAKRKNDNVWQLDGNGDLLASDMPKMVSHFGGQFTALDIFHHEAKERYFTEGETEVNSLWNAQAFDPTESLLTSIGRKFTIPSGRSQFVQIHVQSPSWDPAVKHITLAIDCGLFF